MLVARARGIVVLRVCSTQLNLTLLERRTLRGTICTLCGIILVSSTPTTRCCRLQSVKVRNSASNFKLNSGFCYCLPAHRTAPGRPGPVPTLYPRWLARDSIFSVAFPADQAPNHRLHFGPLAVPKNFACRVICSTRIVGSAFPPMRGSTSFCSVHRKERLRIVEK